ncbi:DUF799 family lipoprotein [bacterium]|nr:DUF799 family lipoprotein [bacterium]MBU1153572.1 DUF799 family lipoprotein [bacterium]MBU1782428.1 DUF799 family lipoprotein [bacterium]
MKKYFHLLFLLLLITLMPGCLPKTCFIHQDFGKVTKVAILPFVNETNDLAGSVVLRRLFWTGLCKKGYLVISLEEVDNKLNELGITEGGQLNSISQEELMKALDVSALGYGVLNKCEYMTVGFYKKKEVEGEVKIYYQGELFWEDKEKVKEDEFVSGNVLENVGEQLKEKLKEKVISSVLKIHPLEPQLEEMTNKLLLNIPGR